MTNPKNSIQKKVFVAGHNGMVGSAICRKLSSLDYKIITTSKEKLDLKNQQDVLDFFLDEKPELVYLAAAKVGGINANDSFPADFIYDNLMIQSNIIHAAFVSKVSRLLFLGSSCIYPKLANQPIDEKQLLTGKLEETNEPYAIAKIAGIKMCESYNRQHGTDFRSVMPTNLYGINDNYNLNNSHVIPALIRKIHEAKYNNTDVTIWGSGKPYREFLYVDDLADACNFIMSLSKRKISGVISDRLSHINIGTQKDISIRDLAVLIGKVIGFTGELIFDTSMPDGTMKKLMDSSKIHHLGWEPKISLEKGIMLSYDDFLNNKNLKM
tara:strand:- start:995 stop:1969 length:975 start_codon:yes stop_codon:yes gene_type:complete